MELTGIANQSNGLEKPLSEQQKAALAEILSGYDPENLSKQDLRDLRGEIADAGIPRNGQTQQIMLDAGFNLRGNLAGAEVAGEGAAAQLQKSELWGLFRQFQMGQISEAEFKTAVGDFRAGMLMRASF